MEDSKVFRVLPNEPRPPFVDRAEGVYIYTKDGQKLLDITSGGNHYAVLGWAHPEVNKAMEIQIKKFGHMDYKLWSNENTEELADVLISRAEHGLDRVYFGGNAGSEVVWAVSNQKSFIFLLAERMPIFFKLKF